MSLQLGSTFARSLFLFLSPSPFITSFCLLWQLSTVMRAVFIATVFLSLFLPFSFSSSSTADCHFALRAAILLCIFHMRLSCGSSVSSAFPAAVDIVVYLFTALPPLLPFSLSPIYVYLSLFVFCCVCSVCAIECNKWHTRMQTDTHVFTRMQAVLITKLRQQIYPVNEENLVLYCTLWRGRVKNYV